MKVVAPVTLIVLSGLVAAVSVCEPALLAENAFLIGFVNHELLNVLAVIVTITIATIATIHIWFNELEEKHQKKVFGGARKEINNSAFWLVGFLLIAIGLLITKSFPVFSNSAVAKSAFNGAGMIILVAAILVLLDVLAVVRTLTPKD